jgi:alpha,alpha-trehalase
LERHRFSELLETHTLAWDQLWRRFEIDFEFNDTEYTSNIQKTLRLYIFHLLQTASIHSLDIDVGMPSRGWHGEAYRGHIFWDEIYIFPTLNYRLPQVTKTLLLYRYRRLGEAYRAARELGYKGAMYPWQSGSDGREESQEIHLNPKSGRWIPDNSRLQRHINAAIVYNIWQYYQVTGDLEFLSFYGAEMILAIASFWASMATYNSKLDRYEIKGIMGPDEYHDSYPSARSPGLNNNAYTNIMAVYVLSRALDLFDLLPKQEIEELREKLHITLSEIYRWRDISHKMRVVFHDDGIISQFEGYDQLEELDWEGYRVKYGDIQRLDRILEAEGTSPNRYKVSKQADVLMLFYLFSAEELKEMFTQLGYPFEYETIPKNINYYINRTCHGSSLSRMVHSWVLYRSDRKGSWNLFTEALMTDVADIQGGTTPEGIHLGAMAGCVDIVQRAYTGIEARGDILRFNPELPEELNRLSMHIRYRGHWLEVNITSDTLELESLHGHAAPIKIEVKGKVFELAEGESKEIALL